MPWYVKSNGAWKAAGEIRVPVDGAYLVVENGYANVAGVWETTFEKAIPTTTTITAASSSVTKPASVSLTVSVTNPLDSSAVTQGTVSIERSLDSGSTWSTITTGNALDGSGQFTYSAATTDVTSSQSVQYRAKLTSVTPYVDSTSSAITVAVTVQVPTTTVITVPTTVYAEEATSISVTLAVTGGAALSGQTVTLSDGGSYSATATTNGSGVATFSYAGSYSGSAVTLTASFAGSGDYVSSSATASRTIALKATSASISTAAVYPYFSDENTITATVAPAAAGRSVTFQRSTNGATWTTFGTVATDSTGKATVTYVTSTPTYYWRAVVAATSTYAAYTTTSTLVTSYQEMPFTVTLTSSVANKTVVSAASTVTFTATVKDVHGVVVTPPSVEFLRETYGVGFTTVSTDTASPFTYATSPNESYGIVAYVPNWTGYTGNPAAASPGQSSEIIIYVTESISADASSSRSYDAAGDYRYANYDDRIYHGYFDSTNGDQRGAIWFNITSTQWDRINNGAVAVTAGSLYIKRGGSAGNSTNTPFKIGTHTDASVSSTWGGISGKSTGLQSVSLDWNQDTGTQTAGLALNSTILAKFRDGAKGITIGPAGSTSSTYYGWLIGANVTGQPYLNLTYYTNPTI